MQPSQEEAVNSLSNIMIYLDKEERLFIEEYLIKNLELFPQK